MYRGSLVYDSFVIGSTMLQIRLSMGCCVKGSIRAVEGSGMTSISEQWIACQPLIDEPSKPRPSSNISSFNSQTGAAKCCQIPGKSRNLKSTITALFSWAILITSFGVILPPLFYLG